MDIPISGLCSRCWVDLKPWWGSGGHSNSKYCAGCREDVDCDEWFRSGFKARHPDRYLPPSEADIDYLEWLLWR